MEDYSFGDEWIVSGGPGLFLVLGHTLTISAQALASYDTSKPDRLLGQKNRNSGGSALYLGPQLALSLGDRVSANVGLELPVKLENQGLQNLPDYRVHAGISWRF